MLCATLILGAHLVTQHIEAGENGVNPGGYAVCDDWAAGAYYNSQRRGSVYAGYVWHTGPVDIITGAVSGYVGHAVAPMVMPSVRLSEHVRLSLIPPMRYTLGGGLHVSAEWRL